MRSDAQPVCGSHESPRAKFWCHARLTIGPTKLGVDLAYLGHQHHFGGLPNIRASSAFSDSRGILNVQ